MTWLDVLKIAVLIFMAICAVCVCISMYNDGKAQSTFIVKNGRYPRKHEKDPDVKLEAVQ